MWVNRQLFDMIVADNKRQVDEIMLRIALWKETEGRCSELRQQKAKDDITIDWMRHRLNALEKLNAQLLQKAGIHVPIPEIVPTRPGTISELPTSMDALPSFEDVGDAKADELGIEHDPEGALVFTK